MSFYVSKEKEQMKQGNIVNNIIQYDNNYTTGLKCWVRLFLGSFRFLSGGIVRGAFVGSSSPDSFVITFISPGTAAALPLSARVQPATFLSIVLWSRCLVLGSSAYFTPTT